LPPSQLSHDLTLKTVHRAPAAIGDEFHGTSLTRFKTNRRTGRDVEPEATGSSAIKFQSLIGFKEMVVRPDLDWPISGI
jgi:hypothetical protein